MKNRTWNKFLTTEQTKDLAYYERNMLALMLADGWYYDTDNNWDGWKRVLSIKDGAITFHIPDDFDVGCLIEIKPNWDGHTTEQKWQTVDDMFYIKRNYKNGNVC